MGSFFANITLILVIMSFISAPIFMILLWKSSLKVVAAFLVILIFESLLAAFYTAYTATGIFSQGIILQCLSPLAGILFNHHSLFNRHS